MINFSDYLIETFHRDGGPQLPGEVFFGADAGQLGASLTKALNDIKYTDSYAPGDPLNKKVSDVLSDIMGEPIIIYVPLTDWLPATLLRNTSGLKFDEISSEVDDESLAKIANAAIGTSAHKIRKLDTLIKRGLVIKLMPDEDGGWLAMTGAESKFLDASQVAEFVRDQVANAEEITNLEDPQIIPLFSRMIFINN